MLLNRRRRWAVARVAGAVILGVVSGKYIFGPPLEAHWKAKLEEEAASKENNSSST